MQLQRDCRYLVRLAVAWGTFVPVSALADGKHGLRILSRDVILQKHDTLLNFPFLHEAPGGIWYLTYREGPHGVPGGDRMHCLLSKDQGKTWQAWDGLLPEPWLRLFRCRRSDGALLSHRYITETDSEGRTYALMLHSKDQGQTWGRTLAPITGLPRATTTSTVDSGRVGLWGHIVEISGGTLLCGIYRPSGKPGRFSNGVIASDDGGKTWPFLATVCADQGQGSEGPNELDLVLLKNGDLLTAFRTGARQSDRLYLSRSTDGGKSWSKPRDTGTVGVSPQLLLLDNGVLVCSYGTRDVYVMASWDGAGNDWSTPLRIQRGPGRGYTDLQALSADTFRMVFDDAPMSNQSRGGRITRVVVQAKP